MRLVKVSLYRLLNLNNLQVRKNKHYLKGKKVDVIVKAAKDFFNEKLSPLISTKALREINSLKDKCYMIVFLSGTLNPFVECFKDYCKADLGIGTYLESENGVFTGEIKGTYAYNKGKADIVKKLAKEYNIDLNNSYAYANQYIDVKFMRLTGFPIAVNASPMLRLYAKKKHWCIKEF
ncbi:MAG: hydrolase [Candidatus Scalindua rubra]|uniref:Hydrolase n=1 Tax=Candidatus Scalindua rubra TaxID=1872076 RepID=A0A1E3XFK1_9BACT|nr:MAG: hydrolase [Candidatus Scalindua rubra]